MAIMAIHPRGANLAEIGAKAKQLEDVGFRWLAVGDAFDAFVTAAVVAQATSKVTISPCVTLLTRSPVQTMMASSGVDDLSNGRFVLGLGVGPADWNRDWHSVNPDRPARRMAEFIKCFKAAWRSSAAAPATVEGEIYSLKAYRRLRKTVSEDLKVMVGVVGPLNTRNSGQYADGAFFDILLPAPYLDAVGFPALLEGARRSGRTRKDLTIGEMVAIVVDADRATARRRARGSILNHIPVDYYQPVWDATGFTKEAAHSKERFLAGDITGALDAITDDMVAALTVAGTPDDVRKGLKPYTERLDVIVSMSPGQFIAPDEAAASYANLVDFLSSEMKDGQIG